MQTPTPYVGRFAPSPTGPLHFGSLVAALASYLDARSQHGKWKVRIEDIDPPREVPGAVSEILRTLESFGFEWDDAVLYQSTRLAAYREALAQLERDKLTYRCTCSRKELLEAQLRQGPLGPVYPGTCRRLERHKNTRHAIRVITQNTPITFDDAHFGPQTIDLGAQIGDFIVYRADGYFAYQLAVVIDDAYQQISHVVRGADLLENTFPQLALQKLFGLARPLYRHVPVAIYPNGGKLSKQTGAPPLNRRHAFPTLLHALAFLGQTLPRDSELSTLPDLWQWAILHWKPENLPHQRQIVFSS